MLMVQPKLRPTATSLVTSIPSCKEVENGRFYGICCLSRDDGASDGTDEDDGDEYMELD